LRAREDLLERDVRDGVLDEDLALRELRLLLGVRGLLALLGLRLLPLRPGVDLVAELALREGVAPLHEGTLGELHDVALVDERDALALVGDGVLEGGADEALGALDAHGLDADAAGAREADLLELLRELFLEEA